MFSFERFLLVGLLLGLAVPLFAFGQVTASIEPSAPTDNVLANAESTALDLAWRAPSEADQRNVGQTFTLPMETTLNGIVLRIAGSQSGAPGAEFTVSLCTFANAESPTPDSVVSKWTGTLPTDGLNREAYLKFQLPETALKANTTYGLLFAFNETAPKRSVNFYQGGGGMYPQGCSFQQTPADNSFTAHHNDFTFYLLGTAP